MPDDLLGRVIGEKYRIVSVIGRGGMATVYLAQQLNVPRRVAIKMASPALIQDDKFVQRFRREIAATASLEHEPHILPVYDVGEGHGLLYIVMPFISGGTLKDKVNKEAGRPWPPLQTLELARQVLSALEYAHQRGFVHRDVKPSNILLEGERAYLADFGIARAMSESGASSQGNSLTASAIIGTPDYMAPEQALGRPVDNRADLYAFGVVLYELFTGGVPYSGSTPIEVALKHVQAVVPPPRERNPALSAAIEQVLFKALSREPDARFRSAREFSQALEAAIPQRRAPELLPQMPDDNTTLLEARPDPGSGSVAAPSTPRQVVGPAPAVGTADATRTALKSAPIASPTVPKVSEAAGSSAKHVRPALRGVAGSKIADAPAPRAAEAVPPGARPELARRLLTRRNVVLGVAAISVAATAGLLVRDTWISGIRPRPLPNMATPRSLFTMTVLPNRQVLVAGGQTDQDIYNASAERYDFASNTWVAVDAMSISRAGHTATPLPSGQVLLVGGQVSSNPQAFAATTERYDPSSNQWSPAATMATARLLHNAVLLPDGQILVLGGFSGTEFLQSVERLEPGAERWVAVSAMSTPRVAAASVVLPNGEVLIVGGFGGGAYLATAERYDPVADRWTTAAPMTSARAWHSATVMSDGSVLVVGGYLADQRSATFFSSVEAYDWTTDTWTAGADMSAARSAHTATPLPNGRLLVVGGQNGRPLDSAELFDPETGDWSQAGALTTARTQHQAVLLPDGNVMVAGGQSAVNSSQATATAEQFDPNTGRWSLRSAP